jgi:hypothetical protein
VATLSLNKPGTILSAGWTATGSAWEKTFTGNITETINFQDLASNQGTDLVQIDRIDTISPEVTLIMYSPQTTTNGSVIITLITNEAILLPLDWEGPATGTMFTRTFLYNTGFELSFTDLVGNPATTDILIDRIDTTPTVPSVSFSPATATNTDVIASISFDKPGVLITNNGGNTHYVFTNNGDFTFQYSDPAGNTGNLTVTVDRIDKVLPVATSLTYSTSSLTNGTVLATLTLSEPGNVAGWDAVNATTFTKIFSTNFVGTVSFTDLVGNTSSTGVQITRIDTTIPTCLVSYTPTTATNTDVVASLDCDELTDATSYTFTDNGTHTFIFHDLAGNTGQTFASVNRIDKTAPQALSINYTPGTATNADVQVVISMSEAIQLPADWLAMDATTITRTFSDNRN